MENASNSCCSERCTGYCQKTQICEILFQSRWLGYLMGEKTGHWCQPNVFHHNFFFYACVTPPPTPPLKSQFCLKKEKELVPMYTITCLNSHVHTSCIYHNLHVSVNRVTMHFEDLYKQCRYKLTNTRQKKISVCIWLFYKWFKSCGSLFCNIFAILNNC